MIRLGPAILIGAIGASVLFVALVPEWDTPRHGTQLGFPSAVQFAPSAAAAAANKPPPVLPPAAGDNRPATQAYTNVKVLTGTNAAQFMRLQQAMSQWVAGSQGCAFCHAGNDYASDAKPAKRVARLMLQMTRHINAAWRDHVSTAGVTCYTCHRGQPVPSQVWFPTLPPPKQPMIEKQEDWNEDATSVRRFFPTDGWSEYLLQDTPGLAQSYTALPTGEASSQIVVKRLYEMMMQMSDGIGVNCGYCHNSRAFFDWRQSTPYRWTGYSGITLTRDLNRNYLLDVGSILPQEREIARDGREPFVPPREKGQEPGNALANCATCHHGAPKPLEGADVVQAYPGLAGPDPKAATAALNTPHG